MSAPVTPSPPLRMARLEKPETIDDVLRNIDQIIDWAIKAESHIGYFAALYKGPPSPFATRSTRVSSTMGSVWNGSTSLLPGATSMP